MAKKAAPKKQKSFEQTLWDTADKLRGTVESSEYKHVVLSLIFLKFVSDKFEARRQELINEGKEAYLDMVEFYTMKNVFYYPKSHAGHTFRSRQSRMILPSKLIPPCTMSKRTTNRSRARCQTTTFPAWGLMSASWRL